LIGRLVEQDGAPVPGLEVELLAVTVDEVMSDYEALFGDVEPAAFAATKGTTRSDDEGRFRFEGIDPRGMCMLGVDLGGMRGTFRVVDHMPGRGETVDVGDVVLEPFVTLTGVVEDEDGAPVGGARVRAVVDLPALVFEFGLADLQGDGAFAWQDDDRFASGFGVFRFPAWLTRLIDRFPTPTTTSAEDGSFTLAGVPAGLAHVVVNAQGLMTRVHGPVPTGKTGGTRDVGTITVEFGEELAGRVEEGGGTPVAGAQVLAGRKNTLTDEVCILRPAGTTGADGRFVMAGVPSDEHLVAVRRPGAVDWTVLDGATPGAADVVIRLDPTHSLTITAHDASGSVVPKPALALHREEGPGEVPILEPPLPLAGRVVYTDDGAAFVEGLGAGAYAVLVRADGFAVAKARVDLRNGDVSEHVTLQRAHDLEVEVTAARDDRPVADATVSAMPADEDTPIAWARARTREDGGATLRGLPEGRFTVRVSHPAYAATSAEAGVPGRALEVALVKGGTLAGRVHEGGRPVGEPRMIAINPSDEDVMLPRLRVTDLDGNFTIDGLAPGAWNLMVMRRISAGKGLERTMMKTGPFGGFMPERMLDVVIADGEETHVDIDLLGASGEGPSGFVRGRVTLNGAPAVRCQVHAMADWDWDAAKQSMTDETGAFDLGAVPAEALLKVTFTPEDVSAGDGYFGGLGFYTRTLRLTAGATESLVVHLRTGRLEGRVVRADDGKPVPMARVLVTSKGASEAEAITFTEDGTEIEKPPPTRGFSQQSALADADGSFDFEPLPEDEYDIEVQADGFRSAKVEGVSVPYGGAPPDVVVRMHGAVPFRGRLELPMDAAGYHVWITAKAEETQNHDIADYDDDTGEFKFENLSPGRYELQVQCWREEPDSHFIQLEPVLVELTDAGITDFVLRPTKKAE
jgi:hypothetical protein